MVARTAGSGNGGVDGDSAQVGVTHVKVVLGDATVARGSGRLQQALARGTDLNGLVQARDDGACEVFGREGLVRRGDLACATNIAVNDGTNGGDRYGKDGKEERRESGERHRGCWWCYWVVIETGSCRWCVWLEQMLDAFIRGSNGYLS